MAATTKTRKLKSCNETHDFWPKVWWSNFPAKFPYLIKLQRCSGQVPTRVEIMPRVLSYQARRPVAFPLIGPATFRPSGAQRESLRTYPEPRISPRPLFRNLNRIGDWRLPEGFSQMVQKTTPQATPPSDMKTLWSLPNQLRIQLGDTTYVIRGFDHIARSFPR